MCWDSSGWWPSLRPRTNHKMASCCRKWLLLLQWTQIKAWDLRTTSRNFLNYRVQSNIWNLCGLVFKLLKSMSDYPTHTVLVCFYSNLSSSLSRGSRAERNEKRGERGSWLSRMRGILSVQKPECWLCILPAGQFSWAKLQPPPGSDRYSSDTRRQLYGAPSHLWKEQQR